MRGCLWGDNRVFVGDESVFVGRREGDCGAMRGYDMI